ncbi:hypothetical protein H5410_006725 [Solanum commersonii]|uniref:Uncharacterized protein n=1 Tax=Solanum commersonii TaxID=4109 RepID=A0A9J6AB37_SOLCO|nr:hypothetical protein H5410_006725 [Solanum commersonii]
MAKSRPTEGHGGLGMTDLVLYRKSMLRKWHWKINMETLGLWKAVIKVKYTKQSRLPYGTGPWKHISKLWDES